MNRAWRLDLLLGEVSWVPRHLPWCRPLPIDARGDLHRAAGLLGELPSLHGPWSVFAGVASPDEGDGWVLVIDSPWASLRFHLWGGNLPFMRSRLGLTRWQTRPRHVLWGARRGDLQFGRRTGVEMASQPNQGLPRGSVCAFYEAARDAAWLWIPVL